MKNKSKISYLWFNLVFCLTTLFGCYVILSTIGKLSNVDCIIIAHCFYVFDVINCANHDYHDDKIKKLESDINELNKKLEA
jgi:hypothetical protein